MKEFKYTDPPEGLEELILKSISKERHKSAIFRLTSLGTISTASLFVLVKASISLWQSFSQTGFYDYLSLIISDGSVITTYWKEFAFLLVESLPLIGLILLLSSMTIFIWSSAKALKDARLILSQT